MTGPSGVGKGTVVDKLLGTVGDLRRSISVTTRTKRSAEVDGIDYFFVGPDEFEQMKQGGHFLEWAEFAGNSYGTPRDWVLECLNDCIDVILVIEVQGAKQIKKSFPASILIFLSPPSIEELEKRLFGRNTECPVSIGLRLAQAEKEMAERQTFDYEVVNDDVGEAVNNLMHIVYAERCRIRPDETATRLP